MASRRQELAIEGELLVVEACRCLRCGGAFRPLRRSTPTAVVQCIECGAPAQIRTRRQAAVDVLPRKIMGGAWAPQAGLLMADALNDLFVVLIGHRAGIYAVHALSGAVQDGRLFRRRPAARRDSGGRHAFTYELEAFWPLFARLRSDKRADARDQVVCAFPSAAQRQRRKLVQASLARPAQMIPFIRDLPRIASEATCNVVPIGC